MRTDSLDLLVLADPHYIALARHACNCPPRQSALALVLVRKALARLAATGVAPDAVVLLGDLVDNGDAPDADRDLLALAGELARTGLPVFAVPGNHDGPGDAVAHAFGTPPGLHRLGAYGLLLFQDRPLGNEVFARDAAQLTLPETVAAANPDLILIALQHHPLHPAIVAGYPYMLANGDDVLGSYRRARVALSLSGHYHAGQSAHTVDGTVYATAPALAEAPFSFLHVRLEGRDVTVRTHRLHADVPGLWDVHCHTEFAYCATSVTAANAITLSERLGLGGVGIVEHAFQLYFPKDYAWSFRWQHEPERVAAAWLDPQRSRMAAYRRFAAALRSPTVRIGMEVDLLGDGDLLLAPADREGWDYLIGAIHTIDGVVPGTTSQAEAERLFLRDVDRLLEHPIHVLAHPFRYFARSRYAKPEHLYPIVARRLAARGVAAEINVHTNTPERAFFRACLDSGTQISLGTDSHELTEVAELGPHLDLLRSLGLSDAQLPDLLFRPPQSRRL